MRLHGARRALARHQPRPPTLYFSLRARCRDHYLPVDDVQIPTGEIAAVACTPFDFTSAHTVGERIDQVPAAPPGGYDHNLVLFGLGPQAKDKVLPSGMAFEE